MTQQEVMAEIAEKTVEIHRLIAECNKLAKDNGVPFYMAITSGATSPDEDEWEGSDEWYESN